VRAVLLDEFGIGDAQARAESWRYSKAALRALEQYDFATADAEAVLSADLIVRFDWPETRGRRIVFVNGGYSAAHSDLNALIQRQPDVRLDFGAHSASIDLSPGDPQTLHIVHVNAPGRTASRWNAALDVVLRGGEAELIEQHIGADGSDVLGALTAKVRVGAGANLRMTTLCDLPESVSLYRREQVAVAESAGVHSTHALCGGRLQRLDLDVELAGVRASYVSRGVFVLRSRQHVDVKLDVRHVARDTRSDVLWRGVADARARGILRGAITVAAGADGADAQLQTKNLLLSPHAEIDAQPVLEIYADEVRASHGATVGQLDERALFYLRSRGLPAPAARNLLIAGFCREAFDRLDNADLRARLETMLAERLPQAAGDAP
jgi:Fe-S cluster assembly protein SufD